MTDIFDVADAFLRKDSIDCLKIQYLCYYFKGWSIAEFDADYLKDYNFYVTELGPLNDKLLEIYGTNSKTKFVADKRDIQLDVLERQLIENIWETYGDWTTEELMEQTRSEPPYLLARIGNPFESEDIDENVRPEHMQIYFKSIKGQNKENLSVEDYYPPYENEAFNVGRIRREEKKEGK